MSKVKTVYCKKLKQELPALDAAPYPGPLGEEIFQHISAQAWEQWMEYQTKLINELKLKVFQKEAQEILRNHAQKFFFEENELQDPSTLGFGENKKEQN